MESREKEIGRFGVGISILQEENGKIKANFVNKNFNVPRELIITELRLFLRMLEDNLYPDFKDNITTIDIGPDE